MSCYIKRSDFFEEAKKSEAVQNCSAGIIDVCNIAISTPSSDVAPVVHGHWICGAYDPCCIPTCSVCGLYISKKVYNSEDATPPYCPHCGAKMDEQEN